MSARPHNGRLRGALSQRRILPAILFVIAYAVVCYLIVAGRLYAHDAPTGWTYPISCCSGVDCREVGDAFTPNADVRVFETATGYQISSTGEVIPYTDRKVRFSPDGRFHLCCAGADFEACRLLCLFAPPRGF